MRNAINDINITFKTIFPTIITTFEGELSSCIDQINNLASDDQQILYSTAFIKSSDSSTYEEKKSRIISGLSSKRPLSVVSQTPENHTVCFEIALVTNKNIIIEPKHVKGTDYLLAHFPEQTLVIAMGLSADINTSIYTQSETVFEQAEAVLETEGISFSDVVRQWNYLEDITLEHIEQGETVQNYQVFNDVRSRYYDKTKFENGYPAATGIGMQSGGVIIDFIGVKQNEQLQITAITNPDQIDAHKYSEKVLVGEKLEEKTTPKFERAKALSSANKTTIFVSGTAAIYGEKTVNSSCIEQQTHETLKIINRLINLENQDSHKINPKELGCEQIRMYVRQGENIDIANRVLKETYPNIEVITLTGNVCRNDLVVEIEAIFSSTAA